jgi:hypothetical protein
MSRVSRDQLLTLADASNEPFADEEEFQRVESLATEISNLFQGSQMTTCFAAFFMAVTDEMARMPRSEWRGVVKLCKQMGSRLLPASEAIAGLQEIADEEKAKH